MKEEKVLLARANLATPILIKMLAEKGAIVTDIVIYKTSFRKNDSTEFRNLLNNEQIYSINFTSPSTVKGLISNIKTPTIREKILSVTALAIGPVTASELKKQGFHHIITADVFTTGGMITKLKESIL